MKKIILNSTLTFFLLACQNREDFIPIIETLSSTPQPTKTLIPSATPTYIPSITPTPCIVANNVSESEYQWCPEHVLIRFEILPGDGGGDIYAPSTPNLILYSDGSLFITHVFMIEGKYQTQILYKKLDQTQICQHLNTFREIGYFDYDPMNYGFIGGSPAVKGAYGSVQLEINAWQSYSASYYELGFFLDDEITNEFAKEMQLEKIDPSERTGWPIIAPNLRSTYYFLSEYPIENFELYRPEKISFWMLKIEERYLNSYDYYDGGKKWDLTDPSLDNLYLNMETLDKPYVILENDEVEKVLNSLENPSTWGLFYEENSNGDKDYYLLISRPMLPFETFLSDYYSQIPNPELPKPSSPLTCSKADGSLPVTLP